MLPFCENSSAAHSSDITSVDEGKEIDYLTVLEEENLPTGNYKEYILIKLQRVLFGFSVVHLKA